MSKKILTQAQNVRVAKNLIASEGKGRFQDFLADLENGVSGQAIANNFGVSRERVRQWKNHFGTTIKVFFPKQLTLDVLANPSIVKNFGKTKTGAKRKMSQAERVTKNFVEKKGIGVFRSFINDLNEVKSAEVMGKKFGMTRERVRQLKNVFGTSKTSYDVHSYINALRK